MSTTPDVKQKKFKMSPEHPEIPEVLKKGHGLVKKDRRPKLDYLGQQIQKQAIETMLNENASV